MLLIVAAVLAFWFASTVPLGVFLGRFMSRR